MKPTAAYCTRSGPSPSVVAAAIGLLLLLACGSALAQTTSTPTPMSELPDVLNGERHVLQIDDLLVGVGARYGSSVDRLYDFFSTDDSTAQLAKQTSGQRLTSYTLGTPGNATLVASGRVFDLPRDVFVSFAQSNQLNEVTFPIPHLQAIITDVGGTELRTAVPVSSIREARDLVLADFSGDGYQDIAFHWGSPEVAGSGIIIGSASSLAMTGEDLRWGAQSWRSDRAAFLDLAAGDVDGDGLPELVGLYHTATELRVVVHPVDPQTLALGSPAGNDFKVADWKAGDRALLEVGKFDENAEDAEIVVLNAPLGVCTNHYCSAYVRPYDVTGDRTGGYAFTAAPVFDIGSSLAPNFGWGTWTGLAMKAGHLDWFGGDFHDQLVIAAGMYTSVMFPGMFQGTSVVAVEFQSGMLISPTQVLGSVYANPTDGRCVADVALIMALARCQSAC